MTAKEMIARLIELDEKWDNPEIVCGSYGQLFEVTRIEAIVG